MKWDICLLPVLMIRQSVTDTWPQSTSLGSRKKGGGGTQFMRGITAWLFVLCLFSASIVISQRPQNTQELVNETASLTCTASAPPDVDVVYVWKFNNHIINFQRDVEYRMVRLCLPLLPHMVALFACHFSTRFCKTLLSGCCCILCTFVVQWGIFLWTSCIPCPAQILTFLDLGVVVFFGGGGGGILPGHFYCCSEFFNAYTPVACWTSVMHVI